MNIVLILPLDSNVIEHINVKEQLNANLNTPESAA